MSGPLVGRLRRGEGAKASEPRERSAPAQAQRLWWYQLVAGGLLLAGETLLANRLSQNAARLS